MKELYQGLGHIAIHTRDMAESIAFYEKIGGALYKQDAIPTPDGEKKLALVEFGGFLLELIQSPTPAPMTEGNIPHFAVYVKDVDAAAAAIRSAGVDTFMGCEKKVLPALFGGLAVVYVSKNWKIALVPLVFMVALFVLAPGLAGSVGVLVPVGALIAIGVARILYRRGIL